MKGGSSKGKEPVIDLNSFSPKLKKTRASTWFYDANKFKSYATSQAYENYFKDAPLLVERVVEQASLLDTNISKWFTTKDLNHLLSNFEEPYEEMVRNFMQMPSLMGMSWNVEFEERTSRLLPPILLSF